MGDYPPSDTTMTNKCTPYICGTPNSKLYRMVTIELLDYLNQPGLTAEKLFNDFGDTQGSFYSNDSQDLSGESDGEWLSWKRLPGWRNIEAATALANSKPMTAQDVMRVPKIGPDHYYDMFRRTLLRMINSRGMCLPIFRWTFGYSEPEFFDDQYFIFTKRRTGEKYFINTISGIPFALDDDSMFFVLPTAGVYTVQMAIPKQDFYNPFQDYQASDLEAGPVFRKTVNVAADIKNLIVDVETSKLSISGWNDKEVKFVIVEQKALYSADKGSPLYNKNGKKCNGNTPCKQYAFRKQEEIEDPPLRTITKPAGHTFLTLFDIPYDFPEGKVYKVLVYSDDDIVVASHAHIEFNNSQVWNEISFPHQVRIGVFQTGVMPDMTNAPPKSAFLQGDIIRQYQQTTPNCGTFSIALAASYWDPFTYNTLKRNGKWVEDEHGDWPPWTGQGTMQDVTYDLGFRGVGLTIDSDATRNEGLEILKWWIVNGVPVIVNIDEYQNTHITKGEHYKVLVGYDDDAVLHYWKKDGTEGVTHGALYFANSGAKGLDEGDPNEFVDGIANSRRENHEDYIKVPIGNDVDSYKAFWYKWKHGGFAPVTDDLWYLAFQP